MKHLTQFVSIILIIITASCQSATQKQESDPNAASVEKVDSASIAKDSTVATIDDPDPSDSIPASAYGINTYRPEAVALAKNALLEKYKTDLSKDLVDAMSRKFVIFEYDLNDDGKKEIFVALNGPYFCGTGGCNALLLSPEGKLITQFTVTNNPIVISRDRTKNWNDLIISSKGKYYLVKFDGNKYPSNPSIQPVFKMVPGDELPRVLDWEHEAYPWFGF